MEPAEPTTLDDLELVISEEASDPDGNTITYGISWTRDGAEEPDFTGLRTIPADRTARGEIWEATLLPVDEKAVAGTPFSASVTMVNSVPTAAVSVSPEAPASGAALQAAATGDDIDGDSVSFAYAWFRDGSPTSFTTTDVPAGETARGETWTVQVTPTDVEGAVGEVVEDSVEIDNSAPVASSVSISPTSPYTNEDLTASASGTDDDGDTLSWTYVWTVDGVEQSGVTGDTLTSDSFAKGATVGVMATPSDGFIEGESVTSAEVVVLNTPPTADAPTLSVDLLYTNTDVTCLTSDWQDIDGDTESYSFTWEVNGSVVGSGATLASSSFVHGDTVSCTATPNDGEQDGDTQASAVLTVANTTPTLASVSISPSSPTKQDTLTATPSGGSDLDGDDLTYSFVWTVAGSVVTGASGATLAGNHFNKGQTVTVQVTPHDGTDAGSPVTSGTVTVANTPPALSNVSLSPSSIFGSTNITATPSASDADGDTITYAYAWYSADEGSGSPTLLSATDATLSSDFFDRDDVIHVVVTASDGDATDTLDSDDVVVQNTAPPAPSSVELGPGAPGDADDLTCTTSAVVDADGDDITYDFRVYRNDGQVDSSVQTGTNLTISGDDTSIDDVWRCEVRASDGDANSAFAASEDVTILPVQTFTFTDTTSDDIEDEALLTFFQALGTVPSSYFLFFEVDDGVSSASSDGAWCAERADWYVDNYVNLAVVGQSLPSGSWQKWTRNIDGPWSSPSTQSRTNYFGRGCGGSNYDWCSEWGLNGKLLAIMPAQTASRGESFSSSWSNGGGWEVTIQVGSTRQATCGF